MLPLFFAIFVFMHLYPYLLAAGACMVGIKNSIVLRAVLVICGLPHAWFIRSMLFMSYDTIHIERQTIPLQLNEAMLILILLMTYYLFPYMAYSILPYKVVYRIANSRRVRMLFRLALRIGAFGILALLLLMGVHLLMGIR